MREACHVETGQMGRVAYGRVGPNEDLVLSVEKLCAAQGFRHAFVRGALGSLVDACLEKADGSCQVIPGPVEVVSLAGEVRWQPDGSLRAAISGVVVDSDGQVSGGPFVTGANPVCVTFELTVEEWLPSPGA